MKKLLLSISAGLLVSCSLFAEIVNVQFNIYGGDKPNLNFQEKNTSKIPATYKAQKGDIITVHIAGTSNYDISKFQLDLVDTRQLGVGGEAHAYWSELASMKSVGEVTAAKAFDLSVDLTVGTNAEAAGSDFQNLILDITSQAAVTAKATSVDLNLTTFTFVVDSSLRGKTLLGLNATGTAYQAAFDNKLVQTTLVKAGDIVKVTVSGTSTTDITNLQSAIVNETPAVSYFKQLSDFTNMGDVKANTAFTLTSYDIINIDAVDTAKTHTKAQDIVLSGKASKTIGLTITSFTAEIIPYVAATSVTFGSQTYAITAPNALATVSATILPATASPKTVKYSISSSSIATIDASTGVITPIANGSVTVTASTFGTVTGTAVLTVSGQATNATPVTAVTFALPTYSITTPAGTATVTASVAPTAATDKVVAYSIAPATIATINASTGVITALANGTATITATSHDGDKTATALLTVSGQTIAVTSIVFALPSYTISTVGAKPTVSASVLPTTATNKTVTYSIAPTTIATIDAATGVITAKANGTATITATSGSKTVTAILTVTGQVDAPEVKLQTVVTQIDNSFTFVGTAKLVNVSGQVVATGVNTLDASSVPTGIYFIIVEGFAGKEVYIK